MATKEHQSQTRQPDTGHATDADLMQAVRSYLSDELSADEYYALVDRLAEQAVREDMRHGAKFRTHTG